MTNLMIIVVALMAINASPCWGFEFPMGSVHSCDSRFSFPICSFRNKAPISVSGYFRTKAVFYNHDKTTTALKPKVRSKDDSSNFDDEFSFGSSEKLEDSIESAGGDDTQTITGGVDLDRMRIGAEDSSQPIDLQWSSPRTKRPRSAASVRPYASACWHHRRNPPPPPFKTLHKRARCTLELPIS